MFELHVPSELGMERAAMDLAAFAARRVGFPDDRIEDIKTAVAEAVVNAIEHGNALDASQTVQIVLIPEDGSLKIEVHDHSATPFTPDETVQLPSIEERLHSDASKRGWGRYLIQALVDEVEYASTSEGNVVRMVIRLER